MSNKCDKERKEYKPVGTTRHPFGGVSDDYEPSPNDRDYSPRDRDCER
jgi:hypothetical protein